MDGLITVSFLQPFPEMLSSSASRFTAGLQVATESQIEGPIRGVMRKGPPTRPHLVPTRDWGVVVDSASIHIISRFVSGQHVERTYCVG